MAKTETETPETETPETKAEAAADQLKAEAKRLGVKLPKVSLSGLKTKDPDKITKEQARYDKELIPWLKNMIAKAKELALMKPIDKRKALLVARFEAIRAKARTYTYSDKLVEAWTEEFNLIKKNSKEWIRVTNNGTAPFNPGNKRKKTAKQMLDGMDLN